jgi:DNA topoisomerase-1
LQPGASSEGRAGQKAVVEAIRDTADRLGNTPAVARRSYVHPAILEAYLDGAIPAALVDAAEDQVTPPGGATKAEEAAVVRLLRQRRRQARSSTRRPARGRQAAS